MFVIHLFIKKTKNRRLEQEMENLKDLEGRVNDMTNKRYQLEQDISTLNNILIECRKELQEYKEEVISFVSCYILKL